MENKAIVFHLTNRGTYSELNNLVMAYSYSVENKIDFYIDDRTWSGSPYNGLDDFFQSDHLKLWKRGLKLRSVLNNTVNGAGPVENYIRAISHFAFKKIFIKFNSIFFPDYQFTPSYFEKMRLKARSPFVIAGKIHDPLVFHNQNLKYLLQYNSKTELQIQQRIQLVKAALGDDFIGCHIRRGDKIDNQMAKISLDLYCDEIKKQPVDGVFIATDDTSVVEYVKEKLPGKKLFTFAKADKSGWVEKEFRSTSGAKKYDDMLDLFTDVETLVASSFFIGTFSSCVGQHINLRRQRQRCHSIDFNFYLD
jgi:hypothetical protein